MQTYIQDNYVDIQHQYIDMQGWQFVNKRFMQKKFKLGGHLWHGTSVFVLSRPKNRPLLRRVGQARDTE